MLRLVLSLTFRTNISKISDLDLDLTKDLRSRARLDLCEGPNNTQSSMVDSNQGDGGSAYWNNLEASNRLAEELSVTLKDNVMV